MHAPAAPSRELATEDLVGSFGPEHPAVSGLRLELTLDGEQVRAVAIELGYRHRGLEKLAETGWDRAAQLAPRVDPLAPHTASTAYALALEALTRIVAPPRAGRLRTLAIELERAANHLAWLARLGQLVQSRPVARLATQLWGRVARLQDALGMSPPFVVPGGVAHDAPVACDATVAEALAPIRTALAALRTHRGADMLLEHRLAGIGLLAGRQALELGASGPVLRGSGVAHDARTDSPLYAGLDVQPIVQPAGDARARYLVRLGEIGQALRLVEGVAARLPSGPVQESLPAVPPAGIATCRVEGPRGELGATLVGDGSGRPVRVAFRGPSLAHAQLVSNLLAGVRYAEVPLVVASLDLDMEEAER